MGESRLVVGVSRLVEGLEGNIGQQGEKGEDKKAGFLSRRTRTKSEGFDCDDEYVYNQIGMDRGSRSNTGVPTLPCSLRPSI